MTTKLITAKKIFNLKRILNYGYYFCTGIRVGKVINEHRDLKNTLAVLAILSPDIKVDVAEENAGDFSANSDSKDLARLFTSYGSDKSTKHNYHLIYASLLKGKRALPLRILEIGLGTNNVNIPSNMGEKGKPGASLRAFRDWNPQALLFGADVDKDVLFAEERIATYFVDQTKPESLSALVEQFQQGSFDLIIDDGLHTPEANLNTLRALQALVKPGGSLVIEDILERYLPVWKIALSLVQGARLIRCKSAYVCIVQKL